MLGNGRGYELYRVGGVRGGMCRWGRVYFLLLAAAHHPPSLLLNVKARAERAALHLWWGAGGCAGCCRLERKSLGIARQLRRVWVKLARAATVSGKQAPAPPTAMPAVHRLAEVIMLES